MFTHSPTSTSTLFPCLNKNQFLMHNTPSAKQIISLAPLTAPTPVLQPSLLTFHLGKHHDRIILPAVSSLDHIPLCIMPNLFLTQFSKILTSPHASGFTTEPTLMISYPHPLYSGSILSPDIDASWSNQVSFLEIMHYGRITSKLLPRSTFSPD